MNREEWKAGAQAAAAGVRKWVGDNPEWAIRIFTAIVFFIIGAWLF